MKIAYISQGFGRINPPVATGSISIWTYEVINELKISEKIIAYEMDGGKLHCRKKDHEGVRYIYAPTLLNNFINRFHQKASSILRKLSFLRRSAQKPGLSSIFYNLGYILWVSLHVRKEQCDIIHVHQFSQYLHALRLFNKKSKIVLHMNCEWLTQLDYELMRKRMAKADLIIGSSDYISEKIEKKFPEFAGKIKTIYNGVHHKEFTGDGISELNNDSHHPELLFVGRVSPEKGIHVLIGAIRKLINKYPSIHLNIVGPIGSAPLEFIIDLCDDPLVKGLAKFYDTKQDGEDYYYKCLNNMVKNDLSSHISFCGAKPHAKVVEYYKKADILVNPSFSESFGMSLAEAMASEKPTISSRIGGMVNVVSDGETGLLVDPDNENALVHAIACLTDNQDLRKRMGISGRQRVIEKFSWERVASSMLTEYQFLLYHRAKEIL